MEEPGCNEQGLELSNQEEELEEGYDEDIAGTLDCNMFNLCHADSMEEGIPEPNDVPSCNMVFTLSSKYALLRPIPSHLFIGAEMEGKRVNKILVDGGAAVSIITVKTVEALGIAKKKVLSSNLKVRSFFGNLTKTLGVLILKVKIGPSELFQTFFVTDCIAPYSIILGRDWIHIAYCVPSTLHQEMLMWNPATDKAELVKADDRPYSVTSASWMLREEEFIQPAPAALDETPPKVKDLVEKINLGMTEEPMEFEDMPGLSPDLVCHRLPIMEGYKPVQQSPQRMSADTAATVKKEWLSNIVPVRKKNGKIRVCVDYMNLNAATPKDVYPMPVADMLVDAVAGHELLSFMDDTAGYHHIPVYEPDRHKTAFDVQGSLEFYIDDVVVKSKKKEDHIENLRTVFTRMRKHKLRMNPAKCIFGVRAGDFLGFIMHERGIEVVEDKAKAVLDALAPRNKKELQTFDKIKEYLTHPPVLRPPQPGIPLKLYISASPYSIVGLLAQDGDGEGGKKIEHAVYYLSRTLLEAKTRYLPIEWLCLALYFAGTKLRHYMMSFTTVVVAQTDLMKYILTQPMLRGRIGKWILALSDFSLQYTPLKALIGQAVSDFLLHHPIIEDIEDQNVIVSFVHTQPWVLYFDGSNTDHLSGAGVALVSPSGARHCYSFQLERKCTNNQAEYEAIIIGLELLLDLEVTKVEVLGDSLLVINQLKSVYKCNNFTLLPFWERASELLDQFANVVLDYIPRERNFAANELAQLATGIRLADGVRERILKVQRRTLPSFMARKEVKDEWLVAVVDSIDVDWRQPIIQYLMDPSAPVDKRVIYFSTNYVLRGDELFRRAEDGLYLRCIYGAEAKRCI
ncbi:uncharacterized protein LOC126792105 [Argentina anserina]|uniref:uncharacterized protein LOC126792105 n=1 Tax=Argentina anserina TaxID=57926 RepID=UPI0021766393|nr:uncharacterized protein LOC126792105 [Potentilla anserina]